MDTNIGNQANGVDILSIKQLTIITFPTQKLDGMNFGIGMVVMLEGVKESN
jgi:hypothetical protein